MKKILYILVSCMLLSSVTQAQEHVYLADTGFITDVGGGGAPASAIFEPNGNYYGYDMNRNGGKAICDEFIVPEGTPWTFDTVILFAYQINDGAASTVTACYLQIFKDGPPGTGKLVWGDTVTNRLAGTGFTGTYRVWPNDPLGMKAYTAKPDKNKKPVLYTNRPIMYLNMHLFPAPTLSPGTYWMAWSGDGDKKHSGPWCPVKVKPGRINPAGQKAMRKMDGKWSPIIDGGAPVGMNMIIKSSTALAVNNANAGIFELYQNIPNPCTGTTKIPFSLKKACSSVITIHNASGQLITTIDNGFLDPGEHSVMVKTQNYTPGTYLYTLKASDGVLTKAMVVE